MAGRQQVIAVIGAGQAEPIQELQAEAVGRALAQAGAVLVCGGLSGVMEAACRGAADAGGTTIGILPGTRPEDANPHVQIALPTGLGYTRNALVVRSAEAVIAVGGRTGTLSEIALALNFGLPVVSLGSWDVPGLIPAEDPEEAVRLALGATGEQDP